MKMNLKETKLIKNIVEQHRVERFDCKIRVYYSETSELMEIIKYLHEKRVKFRLDYFELTISLEEYSY